LLKKEKLSKHKQFVPFSHGETIIDIVLNCLEILFGKRCIDFYPFSKEPMNFFFSSFQSKLRAALLFDFLNFQLISFKEEKLKFSNSQHLLFILKTKLQLMLIGHFFVAHYQHQQGI